jgi:hypothetical protein
MQDTSLRADRNSVRRPLVSFKRMANSSCSCSVQPGEYISRANRELHNSQTTMRKILHRHLKLHE